MTRSILLFVGLSLAVPHPVLAAGPAGTWSPDGSAEAAALRRTAYAQARSQGAAQAGTRGVVYTKELENDPFAQGGEGVTPHVPDRPAVPAPEVVAPSVDPATLQRRYELERIAKRGRSLFIPGVVLSTLGTILLIGSIAGLADEANAVTGGLTAGSVALAATGWPLLVVGVRMRKHPERYLGRSKATAAITPTGFTLRF